MDAEARVAVSSPAVVKEIMTSKGFAGRRVRGSLTIAGRIAAFIVAAAMAASLTACAPVQPYERGKLAHPTMSAGDLAGFGESHLRAISEGATGGNGGTGSGCGCN
jgi:hypothetical protein